MKRFLKFQFGLLTGTIIGTIVGTLISALLYGALGLDVSNIDVIEKCVREGLNEKELGK